MGGDLADNRFSAALWERFHSGRMPVIPDLKARSPQEGDLFRGRDPAALAQALAAAGAPALSVVTEPRHFGGTPQLLQRIRQHTDLPLLRKDFIDRPEQLAESLALGADAVLLTVALLTREQLFELAAEARRLGLEPLVETHNAAELRIAGELELTMIGINNRDIVALEMDAGTVDTTERLAGMVPPGVLIISESAIATPADGQRAAAAGAHAVLIGTAILQAADPADMYRRFSQVGVVRT